MRSTAYNRYRGDLGADPQPRRQGSNLAQGAQPTARDQFHSSTSTLKAHEIVSKWCRCPACHLKQVDRVRPGQFGKFADFKAADAQYKAGCICTTKQLQGEALATLPAGEGKD